MWMKDIRLLINKFNWKISFMILERVQKTATNKLLLLFFLRVSDQFKIIFAIFSKANFSLSATHMSEHENHSTFIAKMNKPSQH